MKYQQPDLRSRLAAEYALGTLRGRARARLERLLRGDAGWREEVTFWNERLADLAFSLPPKTPRAEVWARLQAAVADGGNAARTPPAAVAPMAAATPTARTVVTTTASGDAAGSAPRVTRNGAPPSLTQQAAANDVAVATRTLRLRLWTWRGLALAATVAAVALGLGWQRSYSESRRFGDALLDAQRQAETATQLAAANSATVDRLSQQLAAIKPGEPLPYVAVFAPQEGESDLRWVVSLHPQKRVMRVLLTGTRPLPLDAAAKSLELWHIADDGPHPLGVLPLEPSAAPVELPLPAGLTIEELGMAFTLAVSEEPQGGSPTGKPTGRVLGAFPAARAI